jgi:glutathione synthase/RimK-type ligase-like ATP-grasp enzyme
VEVFLVTHSLNGIPQKLHETESLNLVYIEEKLVCAGHKVLVMDHAALIAKAPEAIYERVIWYASTQYPEYFQYVEDCLLYAEACGGILVPTFSLFRCHENKFFQELLKKKLKLDQPKAKLIGTLEDLNTTLPTLSFPLILKSATGFGSSTVFKIDTPTELKEKAESMLTCIIPPATNLIRRIKQRNEYANKILPYTNRYPLKVGRIVLQEFMPNLQHDWKILVFGDVCFCLKRFVRENDFRASGSGNFNFQEIPDPALLDYAHMVAKTLDTPWASLDIAECDGGFGLIEFQCLHFGLYTLIENDKCYEKVGSEWIKKEVIAPIAEEYFCNAFLDHINKFNFPQ